MALKNLECGQFVAALGSSAAVPGGGGASALAGALGAALGSMVGALTVGKPKYAEVETRVSQLMEEAAMLQEELTALIDGDAEGFKPLAAAYSLPAQSPEEKAHKAEVMEEALYNACQAPLEIMRKSCRAIELQEGLAEMGSRLAISDAGVGAAMLAGALKGAALNVYINTKSMKDRAKAGIINADVEKLLETYLPRAEAVYEQVSKKLKLQNL